MKKRLLCASEDNWQPDGTFSEGIGLQVGAKIIDGGEAVEYAFMTGDDWENPMEAEIEYGEREDGEESEPFFKTSEGVVYWLGDFIRTNLF